MIRFRLTFPEAPGILSDEYESVDDANAAARPFKRVGVKVLVEAFDAEEGDAALAKRLVEAIRKCRPINFHSPAVP